MDGTADKPWTTGAETVGSQGSNTDPRFSDEERAALEACASAAMHCALCDNSDWIGDPERIERHATTLRKMLEG
jgi:hypothetical protein